LECSVDSIQTNRIKKLNLHKTDIAVSVPVLCHLQNIQADANEEAEMIIRAIMQDEVDKSVYAKMADDLERAATKLKKRKVKKVKESPAELTA